VKLLAIPVALAIAVALATAAVAAPVRISAGERAVLLADAREQAGAMGDSHPHDIEAVRTTLSRAAQAEGEGGSWPASSGGLRVYLVAMRGRFACSSCSRPPRVGVPRGTILVLTIPISSAAPSGRALLHRYPRMRRAGMPVRLG
jgi:hypothetical protein